MDDSTRSLRSSSDQRNSRAQLEIAFGPKQALPRTFSPLLPPRTLKVALHGLSAQGLESLRASFSVDVEPGEHRLPLTARAHVRLSAEPGTQLRGELSASPAGADPRCVVQSLALTLSSPLVFHDVLPLLLELPLLFQDHALGGVLASVLEADALGPFAAALAGKDLREQLEAVRAMAGSFARFALERIDGRPRLRNGVWLLELRFTGTFFVGGTYPVRFEQIRLPHVLIPAAHAELARLLSTAPLASAELRPSLPLDGMLEAILGLLRRAEGRVDAWGEAPDVALRALMHDRTELTGRSHLDGPLELSCAFSAEVKADRLDVELHELAVQGDRKRLGAEARVSFARLPDVTAPPLAEALRSAAQTGMIPAGYEVEARANLEPDSCLSRLSVEGALRHPLLVGGFDAKARLEDLRLSGTANVRIGADGPFEGLVDLELSCKATTLEPTSLSDGAARVEVTRSATTLSGRVRADTNTPLEIALSGEAQALLTGTASVTPLPELSIDTGEVRFTFDTTARFDVAARVRRTRGRDQADRHELSGSGTTLSATVHRGELELAGRRLALPEGTVASCGFRDATLDVSGLGHLVADVGWDMAGQSPVLSFGERSTELLVESLRKRAFVVTLGSTGGLTVTGDRGDRYSAQFFNALLNPGADVDALLEVLDDEEAADRVIDALSLFSEGARDLGEKARSFVHKVKAALEAEDVKRPGDGVPAPVLSRMLSRILCGTPALEERIHPLVLRVVDGDGLDVTALKHLVDEQVGDHDYAFELDRVLRWIARLLAPTDPLAAFEPVALGPLEHEEAHRALLQAVPSAREIYEGLEPGAHPGDDFPARVAWVAPYLQLEQLEYLLPRIEAWPREARRRILHTRELKRRVRMISESYGGVAFFPQAIAIAFFLGETLSMGGAWTPPTRTVGPALDLIPAGSLFGPEDVAVLLQASLASPVQGRTEQLNERMLLDHVFAQPPGFLLGVLVELSGRSSYVLAGTLNALLNNDQDCVRAPLDLVAELSQRLGFELPRLSDYIAGGRWAKLSYFEALDRAAQQVLAASDAYLAAKCHVQLLRRPAPASVTTSADPEPQLAIARADAAGRAYREAPALARAEYVRAFEACRASLERDPRAFQLPWMREFWLRNYEALMVLSVVRNVQRDVDQSRRWLETRTGRPVPLGPDDEQQLLEQVVQVLYYHPDDRKRLEADPLVRLLIDPPEGHYAFTVVSAMGVVTEGARGRELEETYRRLEEQRGVRVVRADTATGRSLEYNAVRVEEAVRAVRGPWGIIGYSQGCANALQAEARMLSGTPEQQELVSRLRCRNLLLGAFNGSAHGTCTNAKFLRGIVDGEQFLKHYQGILSREAVTHAQRALRLLFDSRPFVHGTLGSLSLSHEGVRFLQREGQFKDDVPTSTIRGIVEPKTLPEELEWMANVLTKQIESPEHDTQVSAHEAVGYPTWVQNEQAEVLRRCSLDGAIQRCGHWSPLLHEVDFLMTARDRRLAIYDIPKDRHVFPWIEVNARFGVIRPARG